MARRRGIRNEFTKTMLCRALLHLGILLLVFSSFIFAPVSPLDSFGSSDKPNPSSSDEGDCSCGHDWCPELKRCIQPWAETCPIESNVEFSGGTTLSCSRGRCAAPQDNKCSWSWGADVIDIDTPVYVDVNGPPWPPLPPRQDLVTSEIKFATYYWTDLNGHFTIPEGCAGIKCSGCHLSEDDSWADRWRMYLLDRRNDPLEVIVMDAIAFLLPCVIVAICFWRWGLHRKIAPRRIRHAITKRVRPTSFRSITS